MIYPLLGCTYPPSASHSSDSVLTSRLSSSLIYSCLGKSMVPEIRLPFLCPSGSQDPKIPIVVVHSEGWESKVAVTATDSANFN